MHSFNYDAFSQELFFSLLFYLVVVHLFFSLLFVAVVSYSSTVFTVVISFDGFVHLQFISLRLLLAFATHIHMQKEEEEAKKKQMKNVSFVALATSLCFSVGVSHGRTNKLKQFKTQFFWFDIVAKYRFSRFTVVLFQ